MAITRLKKYVRGAFVHYATTDGRVLPSDSHQDNDLNSFDTHWMPALSIPEAESYRDTLDMRIPGEEECSRSRRILVVRVQRVVVEEADGVWYYNANTSEEFFDGIEVLNLDTRWDFGGGFAETMREARWKRAYRDHVKAMLDNDGNEFRWASNACRMS